MQYSVFSFHPSPLPFSSVYLSCHSQTGFSLCSFYVLPSKCSKCSVVWWLSYLLHISANILSLPTLRHGIATYEFYTQSHTFTLQKNSHNALSLCFCVWKYFCGLWAGLTLVFGFCYYISFSLMDLIAGDGKGFLAFQYERADTRNWLSTTSYLSYSDLCTFY